MRRFLLALPLALLTGCGMMGGSDVPTITFEAKPFLKAYMADRDEVIRTTAPAVKKCRTVNTSSPEDLRLKCDLLKQTQAEWLRRDEIVYEALLSGNTVNAVDWEKVLDVAGKFVGAAAGVAL